jgi:beta-glucosidase
MRTTLRFAALLLGCCIIQHPLLGQQPVPPYRNSSLSFEARVNDLLSRMTVEEKVGQLQCVIEQPDHCNPFIRRGVGHLAVPLRNLGPREAAETANAFQRLARDSTRLGIPVLIHDEALHGLLGKGATSFPQAIALAATWDPALMSRIAGVIARQSASRGVRQVLSPVINIARDVRWGRVEETYGEDPCLTSRLGVAFCRPFEDAGVVTTPKHYAANVGEGGRDSHPIHFNERLLREVYFPAFKACFQDGHASSVMAAYNSLDGLPCSSNPWLLTDVLRKEWGFRGFVVSDYGSAGGVYTQHHTAASEEEAAQQTLIAGLDVELPGIYIYGEPLIHALKDGKVPMAVLDTAVGRVLRAKFALGLFDHPFVDPAAAERLCDTREDRSLAREAAEKSIVLLKNDNHTLPLHRPIRSIAVIGPDAATVRLGGYSGYGMKTVSILEGIRMAVGKETRVDYVRGDEPLDAWLKPIPQKYLAPENASPGQHGLRGEYFTNPTLSGPPKLVRTDSLLHFEWQMGSPDTAIPAEGFSARWTGTLTPQETGTYRLSTNTDDGVRLYLDGKLLVDSWYVRPMTADYVSVKLTKGKPYALRVEYYENGGWAFANLGWEMADVSNKRLDSAVTAASRADVAIIVGGIAEGEGQDRADLNLPLAQEKLISAVAATGIPTVVVLVGGSAITMSSWAGSVPAILHAWYPGEEGGNAVADVLFGDANPAGRLPITFPQTIGQVPLFYNTKPSGRGYDYVSISGKPQYAFGYGLSYTQFIYENLRISPGRIRAGESATASFVIRNSGSRDGEEVVQLYVHDVVGSVARPLLELKDFMRLNLKAGESREVSFTLSPEVFRMLDRLLKPVIEPGEFEIMIGASSADIRLRGSAWIE